MSWPTARRHPDRQAKRAVAINVPTPCARAPNRRAALPTTLTLAVAADDKRGSRGGRRARASSVVVVVHLASQGVTAPATARRSKAVAATRVANRRSLVRAQEAPALLTARYPVCGPKLAKLRLPAQAWRRLCSWSAESGSFGMFEGIGSSNRRPGGTVSRGASSRPTDLSKPSLRSHRQRSWWLSAWDRTERGGGSASTQRA